LYFETVVAEQPNYDDVDVFDGVDADVDVFVVEADLVVGVVVNVVVDVEFVAAA
jgi:hypothetical protein